MSRKPSGGASTARVFADLQSRPASDHAIWDPPPGAVPGPAKLFAESVYVRGAMALEALRQEIGEPTFLTVMRAWAAEHAYGNAIDIAAFRLSDGTQITVVKGWWRGTSREKAFLKEAFAGACSEFYTVLGPGSDRHHYNHFHLDLLVTNVSKGRHYCRPQPRRGLFAQADDADSLSTASIKPIPFTGPPGAD